MSHYLYPKGETLKWTERVKPLCFFRRKHDEKIKLQEKLIAYLLLIKIANINIR